LFKKIINLQANYQRKSNNYLKIAIGLNSITFAITTKSSSLDFSTFQFHESLNESLAMSGYKKPTAIQEKAIPVIMEGRDIIASAQTGTGKTAAFLLPVLHKLLSSDYKDSEVHVLIMVPTRELAVQISSHLDGLTYFSSLSSIAVYGGGDGGSFVREKQALSKGVDIVVATPGKLISHLNMGYVKMKELKFLILDEADRMLDMGFHDDIMRIISHLPEKRQTLMFSATMPPKILQLTKTILHNPVEVSVALSKPPESIKQEAFLVYDTQKIPVIEHILAQKEYKSVLVFCSKKQTVKQLTAQLQRKGYNAKDIHSDLDQTQREDVLLEFASKRLPILIATDILSRGIDIDQIELVINFDVPSDGEDYVHRIGRTARAATTGSAMTLINPDDIHKFQRIEKLIERVIDKTPLPEKLGEGPAYVASGPRNKFKGKTESPRLSRPITHNDGTRTIPKRTADDAPRVKPTIVKSNQEGNTPE
jgi:superfamily II DNA/RNA helicase